MINYTANELLQLLTLEEKASLCSGMDTWHTQEIPRVSIPSIMMSDGPHGLRKQVQATDNLGLNESVKAVCFPSACLTACSFDGELLKLLGETLGDECVSEGVDVLLGPAVNLKRSPLCGRNFEYFSEDPFLASTLAREYIKGVQSRGVGTSIKHFVANNQETRRMTVSSNVSERAYRELYLACFEKAIKEGKPKTVMCSYNKINGVYASENKLLLNDILKDEWGFQGAVVSDWGAVNERVLGIQAGMSIEMPSSDGVNDKKIVNAVKDGSLEIETLDKIVLEILNLIIDCKKTLKQNVTYDKVKHHEIARQIAKESIVLLKNDGALPLKDSENTLFVGEFALSPRFQGGGSSHINCSMTDNAFECARQFAKVEFCHGGSENASENKKFNSEAVLKAKDANRVVVFAGLPNQYESEGFDRTNIDIPKWQNTLIDKLCEVNSNVVVVLHNGAPVAMPWVEKVNAIVEAYLGGQGVGNAVTEILFGKVNPSGKLAETFPIKLQDNPSFLNFPGNNQDVNYNEDIFVGYRYYDKKEMQVLFPFGHGLSYTQFSFDKMQITKNGEHNFTVTTQVTNTGKMAGKEVVQIYVGNNDAKRPQRELRGFKKVHLEASQTKQVEIVLDSRAFSKWEEGVGFVVDGGIYEISVGNCSRNLSLSEKIHVASLNKVPKQLNFNSTMEELLENKNAREVLVPQIEFVKSKLGGNELGDESGETMRSMMLNMPFRAWVSMTKLKYDKDTLDKMFSVEN